MPGSIRAGDVLAQRYRLDDLLSESGDARFWHAHDTVLSRSVAVHIIAADDPRSAGLLEAARGSAALADRRILRVLDARDAAGVVYVVNEWGSGQSLDITLADGPLAPRDAAWLVGEVADTLARAHDAGLTHGRLVPENVLVDHNGEVRIIGFAVDAALHGLPPGRRSTDVHDLAGLLYAAMTGRWAGTSPSTLPAAPQDHGVLLRPRRVRAGIPRVLDALCDEVLNAHAATQPARADHDLSTARGVADALAEFVGDAPPRDARPVPSGTGAIPVIGPLPPLPVPPSAADAPASVTDLPTQASMPALDADDDYSALTPREDRPAPPPPFTQPPDRPLFAPDPPAGQPARRPRHPAAATAAPPAPPPAVEQSRSHTGSGFWLWDSSHSSTGSGVLRPVGTEEPVPGRRSMRLAMVIGVVALVVVVVVAALQLRDRGAADPGGGDQGSDTRSRPRAVPLEGVTVRDFDPQGSPPYDENADLVPLATDGDPATAWRTMTYRQDLGPAGLKTGVGLLLDLGSAKVVRAVRLTLPGGPTSVEVFRTAEEPSTVDDLEPVASGSTTDDDALTLRLPEDVADRYVVVWLTSLPEVEGGYAGQVAEVVVAG